MSTLPITGGCLCGAVRYELTAEPSGAFRCHCRDCQRHSSTGHTARLSVPFEALEVTGPLRWFTSVADSGHDIRRGFCEVCGSPVVNQPMRFAHRAMVALGSLDEPDAFPPTRHFHADRAPAWDPVEG